METLGYRGDVINWSRSEKLALLGVIIGALSLVAAWLALRQPSGHEASGRGTSTITIPPSTINSTEQPSTTSALAAAAGKVTRFLAGSLTDDTDAISPFDGQAQEVGAQEVNGRQFARSIVFNFGCSMVMANTSYNLGRHYDRLRTTIGEGDESTIVKGYRFEIWLDGRLAYSATLRRGQSRNVDVSVKQVLTAKLAACSLDGNENGSGGVFGDPRVIGDADKVPTSTTQ